MNSDLLPRAAAVLMQTSTAGTMSTQQNKTSVPNTEIATFETTRRRTQPVMETSSSILILSAISEIRWFLITSNVWESLNPAFWISCMALSRMTDSGINTRMMGPVEPMYRSIKKDTMLIMINR